MANRKLYTIFYADNTICKETYYKATLDEIRKFFTPLLAQGKELDPTVELAHNLKRVDDIVHEANRALTAIHGWQGTLPAYWKDYTDWAETLDTTTLSWWKDKTFHKLGEV